MNSQPFRDLLILESPDSVLYIPAVVLAEIRYLYARKRTSISLEAVQKAIESRDNVEIIPLDERIVERLPDLLNIHDATIVATGLYLKELLDDEVVLITKDQQIRDSNLLPTLW